MDPKKEEKQTLPEAPASVTARVISDQGFHLLFTLRDTSVSGLITKFQEFQKYVLSCGWKPDGKTEFSEKELDKPNWSNGLKKTTNRSYFAQEISAPKHKAIKSEPATCAVCGAPATKKSGTRKDGSLWEGVFCSTGDELHKVWLS